MEKLWPKAFRWHDQNTDQALSFIPDKLSSKEKERIPPKGKVGLIQR